MPMELPGVLGARVRTTMLALLASLAAGCMTQDKVVPAINEVNQVFRNQYESILAQKGTRVFDLPRGRTFAGVRAAMSQLGMRMDGQDADLGYLNFSAPAPLPLNLQEWGEVAQADLPMMREIAARHVGLIPSWFISFEPQGLEIVLNATVVPAAGGSEVSLTMRMRQVTPPPSGIPRREYAPPTGVHKGLDKIWGQIERELGVRGRLP
jgi:hypothetical protein